MTPTGYFLDHLWMIPLFPLATAALMLFFGKRLPNAAVSAFCVGSVGVSFVFALGAVFQLLAVAPEHHVAQQIMFGWLTPGPMQMTGDHTTPFGTQSGVPLGRPPCVAGRSLTGVLFHM